MYQFLLFNHRNQIKYYKSKVMQKIAHSLFGKTVMALISENIVNLSFSLELFCSNIGWMFQ